MRSSHLSTFLCMTSMLVLAGCGCGPDQPAQQTNSAAGPVKQPVGKKRTIAVIPKSTSHVFWKTVEAGALAAAKENNVEIVFKAGNPGDDYAAQIKLVEQMLGQVDGIVLAPVHNKYLAQCVTEAKEKKIPLVVIDSGVESDPADYVSYIATNNKQGGAECAKEMGRLLGGKGTVIMLKYQAGSASTAQREDGFRETLARDFPGIKLAQEKYGETTREDALKNGQQLLNAQDKFDGVFACNESTTFGMLQALRENKKAGTVKYVGFDSAPEFLEAMEKDELNAVAVQNPYKMGYEGVKAVCAALDGKTVDKVIDTGVKIVTKENLKTPEVQALVNPK